MTEMPYIETSSKFSYQRKHVPIFNMVMTCEKDWLNFTIKFNALSYF